MSKQTIDRVMTQARDARQKKAREAAEAARRRGARMEEAKVIERLNAMRTWLRDTHGQQASSEVRLLVADVQAWATTWLQKQGDPR